MHKSKILELLETRTVRDSDWRPAKGTAPWQTMELLASSGGVTQKELAAKLGKTMQSTYRAIVGMQDAGMIANVRGTGLVITKKGSEWAKANGIRVSGAVAADVQTAADDVAANRKAPATIEMAGKMAESLGGLASTSPLGKRVAGTKKDGLGFYYKKSGEKAEWTVTVKGSAIGAQFEKVPAFFRDRPGMIAVLKNPQGLNLSLLKGAVDTAGFVGGAKFEVVGYQADATIGDDDIVISFTTDAPAEVKKEPSRDDILAKRRTPEKFQKRAQRLLKRAAGSGRIPSASRALQLLQKLGNK